MKNSYVIHIGGDSCIVRNWTNDDLVELENGRNDTAATIQALKSIGHQSEPVLISLGTPDVLVTEIQPEWTKLSAYPLATELESQIPIDVEDMVTFVYNSQPPLALIVSRSKLEPLVQTIEKSGIRIAAVVPETFLLVEQLQKLKRANQKTIAMVRPSMCELVEVTNHRIVNWQLFYEPQHLIQTLASRDDQLGIDLVSDDSEIDPGVEHATSSLYSEVARKAVLEVLARKHKPGVNFYQALRNRNSPATGNGLQQTVIGCICILLFAAIMSLMVQSQRISRMISNNDVALQDIFTQTFPDRPGTELIQRALKSELVRLKSQRPHAQASVGSNASLQLLKRVLVTIPQDDSIQIDFVSVSPRGGRITGNAKGISQLESFKSNLQSQNVNLELVRDQTDFEFKLSLSTTEEQDAQ